MKKPLYMIVDYGMGNVGSVEHALKFLDAECFVSGSLKDFARSDAFILPGVGAFKAAMKSLNESGIADELNKQVINKKKPFLGICLGMQLLAKDSMEHGFCNGLGWIDAHVLPLEPEGALRVPHVGWNNLQIPRTTGLFHAIPDEAHLYFDHSFHLSCNEAGVVSATCQYGGKYVAAIQRDNIFAVQFHPEKSQRNGLKILRNYLNLSEGLKPC